MITYKNGEVFQGNWVKDKKNGKYTKYWLDQVEEGTWDEDVLIPYKRPQLKQGKKGDMKVN